MSRFELSLDLNCSPEVVFDFLLRPVNIALITPESMGLTFVDPPDVLQMGSRLEFHVTVHGSKQTLIHEIISLDEPSQFTEQQVQGPFGQFVHEHVVEPIDKGTVRLVDRVEFKPPKGLLGFILTEKRIRSSLKEGFVHRHRELEQLLQREGA
jgi:ligand-binding SRPBCC domain-containing protein